MTNSLMLWLRRALHLTVGASLTLAGILMHQVGVSAAETVVLRYRFMERSVSIEDLTTLAETGEVTPAIEDYVEASGQRPERLQRLLSQEVEIGVVPLDRVLNSPLGDVMIDQMDDFVHTPSDQANRQAMRSALILSASDDDRISLIEILQNYPTQEIHVNGNRFATTARQIQNMQEYVGEALEALEAIGLPF